MEALVTPAYCLVGSNNKPAGMVPIVRFQLSEGTQQLARGWDGAAPDFAPHRWVPIQPVAQERI